ncbi:MAG: BirA family transcriptional regulator [Blastocatellia bacterium]|nr:BirA family transcriptional regulator [Blastocatellia bacterium]
MRQAKSGAPEGLCIFAREQTHGRGRQERVWVSPRDAGLYFSVVLRPQFVVSSWPLITLMTALAVCDTLRDSCDLQADIKWPNDIVAGERKLCGILAETVETEAGLVCVLGIGINITSAAFPAELNDLATSISAEAGKAFDSEDLLNALLEQLRRRYDQLENIDGPASIVRDWTAASSFANGKLVRVDTGSEVFDGITQGLANDGGLRVARSDGEISIVRAGDVQSLRSVSIRP